MAKHTSFERYLANNIKKDLSTKVVLLSGPRQVGKTFLSRHLFEPEQTVYLSFDRRESRDIIFNESWTRHSSLIIFDELHKMKNWKAWIKGVFDTEPPPPGLLVTGSARLDAFRRSGRESLAGRHFLYRLHPLTLKELTNAASSNQDREMVLTRLLSRGGFPEPYCAQADLDADRWRVNYFDRLLREDLRDLTPVSDIAAVDYLVERLAHQVGSPVSYESLSRDIGVHATTVKRWLKHLESIFVVFAVTPYAAKVKGSLLKQPKYYFYDTARIPSVNKAARFENLVACALRKELDFLTDTMGKKTQLNYMRNKQKKEVDFFCRCDQEVPRMIECKLSVDQDVNFHLFKTAVNMVECITVVRNLNYEEDRGSYKVRSATNWLASLRA